MIEYLLNLQYPKVLIWIAVFIVAVIVLMRMNFIKFRSKAEYNDYKKSTKRQRILIGVMRILAITCLIIALASPFSQEETTTKGKPSLTILTDNSTSFELFEQGIGESLAEDIETIMPVSIKNIAYGKMSSLGDSILNNMQGNDNLLIITDGNVNEGRDLGDIIGFAAMINTTISMVDIQPIKHDAVVRINGPRETISGLNYEFEVVVESTANLPYKLKLYLDQRPIMEKDLEGPTIIEHSLTFDEARFYQLKAEIKLNDYFQENNVYYKSVKVLTKPKILIVTKDATPMEESFRDYYVVGSLKGIPGDISHYYAVILNDLPADDIAPYISMLTEYVTDGNGLFFVGGKNSFDKGGYKDSVVETLTPCIVGIAQKREEAPVNIVIALDISGSTGVAFGTGSSSTKVDVEKALALSIIDDMRPKDSVGVAAFNMWGYEVSPLKVLMDTNRNELDRKIRALTFGGGTRLGMGLKEAYGLMANAFGTKNIIVISDGLTDSPNSALNLAKDLASKGIKVYAVGVGANTDEEFMSKLAKAGNGFYFKPDEKEKLKLIFDKSLQPPQQGNKMSLLVLDGTHFITRDLALNADVTGLNFVVPKSAARMLIATNEIYPILSVWNFGLGRVAALSTDDGSAWAGSLVKGKNAKIFSKITNWVIGDPSRKKDFDISVKDTYLGESTFVNVYSTRAPYIEGLEFSKVGENKYTALYTPEETGFATFWQAFVATNYNSEYLKTGLNPELKSIIGITGGKVFSKDNVTEIIDFVKEHSVRKKIETIYHRWPLVIIAIILFLTEIFIRRIMENRTQ